MRRIEFLGLPGSGKTTLARELATSLEGAAGLEEAVRSAVAAHGHDASSRAAARVSRSSKSRIWKGVYARSTDRFDALARFLSAQPRLMEVTLAAQRERSDRDRGQDLVLGWLLNLMARYQIATEADQFDSLIIDEGFCQRAVALFGFGFAPADESRLGEYLAAMPPPAFVIAVETPLAVCEERLEKRGWSERVIGLSPDVRRGFLETSSAVVEAVSDRVEEFGARLIRVDGTASIPDTVASTVSLLGG